MRRILLDALVLGLLCAASAQAGSYTNTFNSANSTNGLNFGGSLWDGTTASRTGSAAWIKSGGAGPIGGTTNGPVFGVPGDGYLQMTFASEACGPNYTPSSYLCGGVLFDDFDPGEVVAGFTFECDLRMGNGNPAPADGFSINYVRNGDPVLTALAAGDTFPQMNNRASPNGGQFRDNGDSADLSLMEEGTQTGLAIGFDMWDSGDYTVPANPPAVGKWAPGFTHDQIGLDISVDDVLVIALEMPNGTTQGRNETPAGGTPNITDSNGNNAATDPTSIETGPYDGTGCPDGLAWCHFKVVLDPSTQTLSVWWKNTQLVTNAPVNYFPSPGRLLMAARVGGSTANIDVDNVVITTSAMLPSACVNITTPPPTQTAEMGSVAWFFVEVTNTPPTATYYQWCFNATNALGGATNSYVVLTNVQSAEGGAYTVVVTNICGAATSAPALLSVIAPVERRIVPALNLTGDVGSFLHLDYLNAFGLGASWLSLSNFTLLSTPQLYLDLSEPLPAQRFYRAWQTNAPSVGPALDMRLATEIPLTGEVGSSVRIDYINQYGPTDAWVTLDTVTLTNSPELYFDVTMFRQPTRLYRLVAATTIPVLAILAPTANQTVNNALCVVSGTTSDKVAVTDVWYRLNGAGWTQAVTTNGWTNWSAQVTLSPGTNLVQAYAQDAAGNLSLTNSVSFVYASGG